MMEKVMLIKAENPESWGWEVNPVNTKVYNLEDIPSMYGRDFFEVFTLENFIEKWQDEDWTEEHGKWVVVDNKGGE